jgi:hypothetical protein
LTEDVFVLPLKMPGMELQFLNCAAPSLVSVLDTKPAVNTGI